MCRFSCMRIYDNSANLAKRLHFERFLICNVLRFSSFLSETSSQRVKNTLLHVSRQREEVGPKGVHIRAHTIEANSGAREFWHSKEFRTTCPTQYPSCTQHSIHNTNTYGRAPPLHYTYKWFFTLFDWDPLTWTSVRREKCTNRCGL